MANESSSLGTNSSEVIENPSAALDGFVGYNLKRAYIHINADFRKVLEADDLPPRVFSTLSMVVESPGIKQIDVARLLGIKRSGLVAIVDGLEARGLVESSLSPNRPENSGVTAHRKGGGRLSPSS
jgi:hypothetical protein